jgi:hypothetical protein
MGVDNSNAAAYNLPDTVFETSSDVAKQMADVGVADYTPGSFVFEANEGVNDNTKSSFTFDADIKAAIDDVPASASSSYRSEEASPSYRTSSPSFETSRSSGSSSNNS